MRGVAVLIYSLLATMFVSAVSVAENQRLVAQENVHTVKEYGARGDTRLVPGVCEFQSGSRRLSCPSANFISTDEGKLLLVHQAGAEGSPLFTKISLVESRDMVLMSEPAQTNGPYYRVRTARLVVGAGVKSNLFPGQLLIAQGGDAEKTASFVVDRTKVIGATVVQAGSGGADGICTMSGATGAGSKVQVRVRVKGGSVQQLEGIAQGGDYYRQPGTTQREPVIGCNVSGAAIAVQMGVSKVRIKDSGAYRKPLIGPANLVDDRGLTAAQVELSYFPYEGALFGTDDTASVTAAIANSSGSVLRFPPGDYWLGTQSKPIRLDRIALVGDAPATSAYAPYVGSGATILLNNRESSAFLAESGVSLYGLSFYYPEQDGLSERIVSYPALFQSLATVNMTVAHVNVINAYELFYISPEGQGSGLGRTYLTNVHAYCVSICFDFRNGMADVLSIDSTSYFGPGLFGAAPKSVLGAFTAKQGAFVHIDIGASAYKLVDGLMLNGFIVQGMRHGVRLLSGILDVSNWSNVNWDAVGSVLSVENDAAILSTSITGGEIYSTNTYDQTAAADVFSFTSTSGTSELNIAGVNVSFAQGSVVRDSGTSLASLNLTGNTFANFGRSAGGGRHYGVVIDLNSKFSLSSNGNVFQCDASDDRVNDGIALGQSSTALIAANRFSGCRIAIDLIGPVGRAVISGNLSTNTIERSLRNKNSSLVESGSSWDRP